MALPAILAILPFVVLLACIALAPLFFADWWERSYPKVSFGLGALVLLYYALLLREPQRITETAREYFQFIVLIGSLFTVSGGIQVNVGGRCTPLANSAFLLIGALLANLIGTTGASMLLIRPWLRMNRIRLSGHHVVFFIFIVSNVGGLLTPIGDPPLYLGYLKGIPFWWVGVRAWPIWAIGVGSLLTMFYLVDLRSFRGRPRGVPDDFATAPEQWQFQGLGNIVFLALLIGASFVKKPIFFREGLMLLAASASYYSTSKSVREANQFSFHPLKEVAILFAGIFATMIPALDWLAASAARLGTPSLGLYYAGCGLLSSVLDNAPTYLTFLTAGLATFVDPAAIEQVRHALPDYPNSLAAISGPQADSLKAALTTLHSFQMSSSSNATMPAERLGLVILLSNPHLARYVVAISVGAVFFGATTYIGNGPNLMVKAIAQQHKVQLPTFLGYILRFTLPFMVPMLAIVWWLHFRR
jgi:Na+/H+ antiporter NhaD/arsenite permease-like protein